MTDLLVIAGLSGAGRSQVGNVLEDLGWYVIDNLPTALIPEVADSLPEERAQDGRLVLVLGASPDVDALRRAVAGLRGNDDDQVRLLFLDAATETLVNRYESTRRRHPYGDHLPLAEAIDAERAALAELRSDADLVIDTTDLNVHQLADRIRDLYGDDEPARRMRTTVMSFGYKHGLPRDVDLVFDCRFLPNPHWEPELRPLTGLDEPVRDYVLSRAEAVEFVDRVEDLLELLLPSYIAEGKSYLTIAFGCTGGQHRSVAIAEAVAGFLGDVGHPPLVVHRDVPRSG